MVELNNVFFFFQSISSSPVRLNLVGWRGGGSYSKNVVDDPPPKKKNKKPSPALDLLRKNSETTASRKIPSSRRLYVHVHFYYRFRVPPVAVYAYMYTCIDRGPVYYNNVYSGVGRGAERITAKHHTRRTGIFAVI